MVVNITIILIVVEWVWYNLYITQISKIQLTTAINVVVILTTD